MWLKYVTFVLIFHILVYLLYSLFNRYGADPMPCDGGTSAIIAILDKLLESSSPPRRSYLYQLVSCLNILLSSVTIIDMPYRVRNCDKHPLELYNKYFTGNWRTFLALCLWAPQGVHYQIQHTDWGSADQSRTGFWRYKTEAFMQVLYVAYVLVVYTVAFLW